MSDVFFHQDPRLSAESFVLKDGKLIIFQGKDATKGRAVPLTDIRPDFEQTHRRLPQSYLVPLCLAGLFGVASWRLFGGSSNLALFGALVTAFMSVVCFFLMDFSAVEVARFFNRRGELLFEICRPPKEAYKYDEFLSELGRRIRAADGH